MLVVPLPAGGGMMKLHVLCLTWWRMRLDQCRRRARSSRFTILPRRWSGPGMPCSSTGRAKHSRTRCDNFLHLYSDRFACCMVLYSRSSSFRWRICLRGSYKPESWNRWGIFAQPSAQSGKLDFWCWVQSQPPNCESPIIDSADKRNAFLPINCAILKWMNNPKIMEKTT